jgi:glycosyltransferase involved in cell wall biosynthesis
VHFHDLDLLPWMALLSFRKLVVYDCHENYPDEMLYKFWISRPFRRPLMHLVRWGQKLFACRVRNVVLVTPSQRRDFQGTQLNCTVIRNYASRELLHQANDDYARRPSAVVFTGSHYVENGTLLLLEIATRLRQFCPEIVVYATDWFPEAALRTEVLAEIERRGLESSFRLFEKTSPGQIMTVLNRATIGISPNLRTQAQVKAVPTKLFEYMAAALPIVASDLPVAREVVGGTGAGLLADPDDPDSFVNAICTLVKDRARAEAIGKIGQQAFLSNYSWESQHESLLQFYDHILATRPTVRCSTTNQRTNVRH